MEILQFALGMAAIVLGEAGSWRDKYDPKNWFNRAHGTYHWQFPCFDNCDDGLEDNFFHGRHIYGAYNTPTTNSKGTAGAFSLWLWGHDSTS